MREIRLPPLGEGVSSGTVVGILVKEGEFIQQEQSLIEVETDKVTTEIPADYAGYVSKIMVTDGQDINQGEIILILEEESCDDNNAQLDELPKIESKTDTIKSTVDDTPSMTDIDMTLPSLGEGVDIGTVISVLVSEGDLIEAEQELIEVETDKVTIAVPSDYTGEVLQIYVAQGDEISIGAVILKIRTMSTNRTPTTSLSSTTQSKNTDQMSYSSPELEYAASMKPPSLAALSSTSSSASSRTTPRARKLARQLNVDLQNVNAPNGLITMDLIKSYVRTEKSIHTKHDSLITTIDTPLPSFDRWGETRHESISPIMKATAKNMAESWRTIPHAWLQEEADITILERERKQLNLESHLRLSTTVYIIKALTWALKEFPIFNASIDLLNNQIIYKDYYNIGVAVDTIHGLYVPVVKNTDQLGLKDIGDQLKTFAQLAKSKKLKAEDIDGGNITISNLGVIGTTAIFPIILSPQVSIVGVAGYQIRNDQKILPMTIAFDHRIINGADAARFLRRVKFLLEHPYSLIFN